MGWWLRLKTDQPARSVMRHEMQLANESPWLQPFASLYYMVNSPLCSQSAAPWCGFSFAFAVCIVRRLPPQSVGCVKHSYSSALLRDCVFSQWRSIFQQWWRDMKLAIIVLIKLLAKWQWSVRIAKMICKKYEN